MKETICTPSDTINCTPPHVNLLDSKDCNNEIDSLKIDENAAIYAHKMSYQIFINAYLLEVAHTWKYYENSIHINVTPDGWSENCPVIHITLAQHQYEIIVAVNYHSLTLRHQLSDRVFGRPIRNDKNMPKAEKEENRWRPITFSHFITSTMSDFSHHNHLSTDDIDTLVFRCLQSKKNMQLFIQQRYHELETLNNGRPLSFIDSEQSLLIGHQLHPISKSREGFSQTHLLQYSPETAGQFQLHYFSIDTRYIHQDSALKKDSTTLIKEMLRDQLTRTIEPSSSTTQVDLDRLLNDKNIALIPVHPWQADHIQHKDTIKQLENDGVIHYLGPLGEKFTATTSIRTVFNKNCPFMFKFSLNMRITNSERVNQAWELDRVVESARMMQMPVAKQIKATAPSFSIVNEPAYISVKVNGKVLDEFSCILRDASDFTSPDRDISAITSLVQDNPLGGQGRLHHIINNIAKRANIPTAQVAKQWFERYLNVAIEPLMKLFIDWGLCFEPHGQNTLLELKDGYPKHCFCRDGQGFFHRQASHQDWCQLIPNKGEATESIFPEELAKERLIYYPFINQAFSVINAFGTQQLADEHQLMGMLRERLRAINAQAKRYPFSLFDVLENHERLPCKGNLLTQLYDMDELIGDIATQSVYVTVPNVYRDGAEANH